MPGSAARNQVVVVRPGIASTFCPSSGTHQSWITSLELITSSTAVPAGTNSVLAAVDLGFAPSGYANDQVNCWASTCTFIGSLGTSFTVGSLYSVYPAMPITISTGTIVQPSSSLVEPCVCGGSGSPGRARNRIAEYSRKPPTSTKIVMVAPRMTR